MRCIVTGGAGFIGSHLAEELRKEGHTVTVIDNLSVGDQNIHLLKSLGIDVVVEDIEDYHAIQPHFKDADVVYHLAAMNRASRSIKRPIDAHHANITGTLHVLQAMRDHDVPKIVFASSSSVYAGRQGLLKEDDDVAPPHPYGVGKLAGEHYVRIYGELFGIKPVTLRFFSVYGPRQLGTIDKAGVVAKFIHQARQNKPITIYGEGTQMRNFTYVKDVVRCCKLAAQNAKAEGHVINVAHPEEITIKEVANSVLEVTNENANITHHELPEGDPPRNPADVQKAQEILEYYPQKQFDQGIQETVGWYDANHA